MDRLEEFIFSDKNCLDSVVVEPLFITPKDIVHVSKSYYSEFDLEYEKYGYECYEQIEDSAFTEVRWKNKQIGMTFDQAFAFSRKMNNIILNESDKFKFGGFALPYYMSLGVSLEDLLILTRKQLKIKYDIKKLVNNKKTTYKINLKNVLQK
jgi:hypothetical protein